MKLSTNYARLQGEFDTVKLERDYLRGQVDVLRTDNLDAEKRAAAAEAKLELIEREAVISVVHSPDNKPPPEGEKPRSWLDRLLGR
jgi:hypothetical protein